MNSAVIVSAETMGDWSLLVRDGDVLAVRQVTYDGQLIYSTEDIPNRADKNSEYGLGAREVVRRFVDRCDDDHAFGELIDRVQVEIGKSGVTA